MDLKLVTNPFSGCQICSVFYFCSDSSSGRFWRFNWNRFLILDNLCKPFHEIKAILLCFYNQVDLHPSWLNCRVFIYKLNDCGSNGTQTHNHLVRKGTLNHLAKLAKWSSCVVSTYLYGAFDCMFSQHSSIIWPVWLHDWVFVYELSGYRFESSCSLLNFRYRVCFEQQFPWHSGNYRVWIHSESRTWHDKNMQSNAPYR